MDSGLQMCFHCGYDLLTKAVSESSLSDKLLGARKPRSRGRIEGILRSNGPSDTKGNASTYTTMETSTRVVTVNQNIQTSTTRTKWKQYINPMNQL